MKIAKITPIYKKGDKHDFSNCRPLSYQVFLQYLRKLCINKSIHILKIINSCVKASMDSGVVILLNQLPITNVPNSKSVLPSAAQTRNSTGLKMYTCIFILTLLGDQKLFLQPSLHLLQLPLSRFLPSAAKTTCCTGLKICISTVLTLKSDQEALSQPAHQCNFLLSRRCNPHPWVLEAPN